MEKGKFNGIRMIQDMRESFLIIKLMDKVLIILEMVKFMKGNLKMGICMDVEDFYGQMEKNMKEIIIWGESKVMESLFLMIECILGNGMMECIMGMEN